MGMQGQSSLLALWGRQLRVQSQHSEAQRDAEEEREMPEGESREGEDPTTSGAIRGGQACTSEVSGCSPSESAAPRAERCLTRNKGEAPVVSTAAKEGSPNIRQNTQGGGSGHAKKRQRKDQPATSQMTLTYCFASAPQCHGLAPVEQTGGACPASMDPTPLSDSDLHMTDKDASTRQRILRAAEQPAGSSVQERVHPEAPATENGAVSAEMGDPVGDQSGGTPNAEASGRVSSSAAAASPGARFTQRMNQATTSGCSTMWCPPPAFCPALSTMPRSLVPAQRGSRQGMGHSMRGPSKPRPATEHSRKSLSRQLHLDLGQADFAYRRCPACGLVYASGEENDERIHAEYHRRSLEGIRFKDSRKARVVFRDQQRGRVIMVLPGDSTGLKKQVSEVCHHVERDLGMAQGWLQAVEAKAFLYVCSKHRVLGLVLTEGIRSARRIAEAEGLHAGSEGGSEFIEADLNPEDEKPGRVSFLGDGCTQGLAGSAKRAVSPVIQKQVTGHPGERSAPRGIVVSGTGHTVSAVCGVRAMWVAADARRQKIATKLLDSARCECLVGYVVPRQEVAFCHPTDTGRAFASFYTGSSSFLVYDC